MNEEEMKRFAEETLDTPSPTLTFEPFLEEKKEVGSYSGGK